MTEQILDLEVNDDITSIRSRIDFVLPALTRQAMQQATTEKNRPRLLLVVPRKNQALQSLVNMKLLARTVQSRAVDVALVSGSPTVRDYAKEADLKVFGSVRAARRAGWITTEAPVSTPETTLPPVAPPGSTQSEAEPTPKRRRKKTAKKKFDVVQGDRPSGSIAYLAQQLGMLVLIVLLAAALVLGFIGLLPRATVTLTPVAQAVETELTVTADPAVDSVDFGTLTFPARRDQVELRISGEIETIETQLAPVEKGSGTVVFINRTEDEHIIPISTTLTTSAGEQVEFLTGITATIPPGLGSTTTPTLVIAVEPGRRGNVRAGQINRFADSSFNLIARVLNENATSGGALAPARIVVEDDKPRLDAYLSQQVQQEGLSQLRAQLGPQEFIPPESVQVIVLDIKYREFSGDFSDTFGGEIQAVVRTTVIGGYNANRLALAALEAQVPSGYELDINGLNFGAGEVTNITPEGKVTFKIFTTGQAVPVIDDRAVAEEIAWLSIGDAQNLLSQQYQLATVPGVNLQPEWLVEWLGRLPFSPLRINVVVNQPVTLMADGG